MDIFYWGLAIIALAYFGCAGVWFFLLWGDERDDELPVYMQLMTLAKVFASSAFWVIIIMFAIFETRKKNRPNG